MIQRKINLEENQNIIQNFICDDVLKQGGMAVIIVYTFEFLYSV